MKKLFVLCIGLVLVLSACGQKADAPASPTTLDAQEETLLLPGAEFEAFYQEFKAAISNKDMQFIDSILDDETSSGFGGGTGKEYFHECWAFEEGQQGQDLWTVLEELNAKGGVHYPPDVYYAEAGECFVAPYGFVQNDFDPGDYRMCLMRKDSGWKLLFLVNGE